MIQLQTSWMVLQIPNVRSVILITQDDGVTDQKEMSNNDSDDAGESTMSSDIEDNDLDNH
jgi:hypothetical protein